MPRTRTPPERPEPNHGRPRATLRRPVLLPGPPEGRRREESAWGSSVDVARSRNAARHRVRGPEGRCLRYAPTPTPGTHVFAALTTAAPDVIRKISIGGCRMPRSSAASPGPRRGGEVDQLEVDIGQRDARLADDHERAVLAARLLPDSVVKPTRWRPPVTRSQTSDQADRCHESKSVKSAEGTWRMRSLPGLAPQLRAIRGGSRPLVHTSPASQEPRKLYVYQGLSLALPTGFEPVF